MANPPLSDDPTIAPSAQLWRRLHPSWVVPDENAGQPRISSAAFDDSRDGSPLSVLIADVVADSGRLIHDVLAPFPGYGIAAMTAADARAARQGVARTPEPDEPAHGSVFGPKTGATKKAMARAARLLVRPALSS
jgi:hypothetical protein